ncbi:MAG: SIS domain-containing protein [Steroidobacter sp.]
MQSTLPGFTAAQLETRGAQWTAHEIAQQPAVWADVTQLVAAQRARLDAFLVPLLLNPSTRLVFTGAGTSSFIGDCLAPAVSAHLRRRVESLATTNIVSGPQRYLQRDLPTLLVSFARSGNSPESVATVELAERVVSNVHHLIITCNAEGELAKRASKLRSAHVLLLPDSINDRGFAMTSSFTSMVLVGGLIFGAIREQSVPALCRAADALLPKAWSLAQRLVGREFQRVVYLGSNELSSLASEAALKLLELTDGQVVALGQSTLGFRHGPKTIINNRSLVVLLLSNDAYVRAYDEDLLAELRRDARAGEILAVTAHEVKGGEQVKVEGLAGASDLELAMLYVIVAQTYALTQSLALGLTPDRPNAAGVVNRVVQGVTIHPWRE